VVLVVVTGCIEVLVELRVGDDGEMPGLSFESPRKSKIRIRINTRATTPPTIELAMIFIRRVKSGLFQSSTKPSGKRTTRLTMMKAVE
jgi:hypothetical protein